MNKKRTSVEVYLSTVFKWGLIILVSACMCATVMFNTEKLIGLYPEVPWLATIGLGIMDSTFFVIALFIIKSSFDEEGYLKKADYGLARFFRLSCWLFNGITCYTCCRQEHFGVFCSFSLF